VEAILRELPKGVELVGAVKDRTIDEILEAIEGGLRIIGENYIQEAKPAFDVIGRMVKWHFIGRLQKRKVRQAAEIFDMIETIDSIEIAKELDRRCKEMGKEMPILIEVNSGREPQKGGIFHEDIEGFIKEASSLKNIKIMGLMTMGPRLGKEELFRPYFSETRKVFEKLKGLGLQGVEMRYLSMGMTDSYHVAIEEGANIVRIGKKIFGERE